MSKPPIQSIKKTTKSQLRKHIQSLLTSLTTAQLQHQSQKIHTQLLSLPEFQNAHSIAIYMNMPTCEVQTLDIIKSCFELGKEVYLPHCSRIRDEKLKRYEGQKSMLKFYKMPSFQSVLDLKPIGVYKLLEPTSGLSLLDESTTPLDLLILPGVAFTSTCYRMGHGAGFYDDFVKRHVMKFGSKPGKMIGVGLKEQLVDNLPLEEHDERLDAVIISDQYYKI